MPFGDVAGPLPAADLLPRCPRKMAVSIRMILESVVVNEDTMEEV